MVEKNIINLRRYFHSIAEPGWMEFQTTDTIIQELKDYDLDLKYGKEIYFGPRLGLADEGLVEEYQKTFQLKTKEKQDEILQGFTGAIATIDTGTPGPVVGFRFDIDSNDLKESKSKDHLPTKEGFRSTNDFGMHACGHDAHASIGVEFTKYLATNKEKLKGKYYVIFQPAEEGVRGASAMVDNPIFEEMDYMVGMHIGIGLPSSKITIGSSGFLATTKLDVTFKGLASHAGASPEEGKNAVLAAASAILNLNSLTQHSKGASRLNVGVVSGGSGRNIIANLAKLVIELRGENEEIISYLNKGVDRIIKGSAIQYDVDYKIQKMGSAPALLPYDEDFKEDLTDYYKSKGYDTVPWSMSGSEDVAYFLNRVKTSGGKSIHIMLGSDLKAGHHNELFDINEDDLITGYDVLVDFVDYVNNK